MFDVSRAVLYSIEGAGLALSEPVLVINDQKRDLQAAFPKAAFWNPDQSPVPELQNFKSIVLFAPKQKDEMRYLMALSLEAVKGGGVFAVAASNEAGGKILSKALVGFGVKITDTSKHKCRVVWTSEPERAAKVMIDGAKERGSLQQRADGLWTQAGLFSWDHMDIGTDALLHHLPFSLSGNGADFGCGIGVIGTRILQRYKDVNKLICVDRDIRALAACEKNLENWPGKFETKQMDLTKPVDLASLDFIVMNPPFHTGKKQSIAMGQAFIVNASRSLKQGGVLVFVANSHLPYEETLAAHFTFHRTLNEAHGFKIIEAVR